MQIDIIDQTNNLTNEEVDLLERIVSFASGREKIPKQVEVSITIVSDEEIKSLNNQYRNKNEATDVLSFEMDNPFREVNEELDMPIMLGDIIISYDKAEGQARRYNHSFRREIAFLAVHGFLHLLGYTHDDKEEEKVMFEKQEAILEAFSLERK